MFIFCTFILYNHSMIVQDKRLVISLLQPVFDSLVDMSCTIYDVMKSNLPASMPDDQKQEVLKQVIKNQADMISASIKNAVPKDLDAKIKEALNGRK